MSLRALLMCGALGGAPGVVHFRDLAAQTPLAPGRARVSGLITDSTGRPIVRGAACRETKIGESGYMTVCQPADTNGRFVHDNLLPGTHVVVISCATTGFFGLEKRRDSITLAAEQDVQLHARIDATGCDVRPLRTRAGVFEGIYEAGFEHSRFRACGDSVEAWVNVSRTVESSGFKWPRDRQRTGAYSQWFVRWRGVMEGPGRYGHMGSSDHLMRVDSIELVRRPTRRDCR